jgi:hypothetical protein
MDSFKYAVPVASGVTYFGTATNNGLMICVNALTNNSPVDVVHYTSPGVTAWFRYRCKSSTQPLTPIIITPAVAAGVSYDSTLGSISVLRLM